MKVVICGAGEVGRFIAKYLSEEDHEVVLIDDESDALSDLDSRLDIQTLEGSALNPDVLKAAGTSDADMFISVTNHDEVNMLACLEAYSLFNVPLRMGRIRSGFFLDADKKKLQNELHMDVIISPEHEIAKSILRNLKIPSALELIPLTNHKVCFLGLKCLEGAPFANIKLSEMAYVAPNLNLFVARIFRDGKSLTLSDDLRILPEDEVYFLIDYKQQRNVLELFGHEKDKAQKIVILGGGRVGYTLASMLEDNSLSKNIVLLEKNEQRAMEIAKTLSSTLVIKGDGLDEDILDEVDISTADVAMALSNEDEENILLSLLAKKKGAKKTFALINKAIYNQMISQLGIDVIVDPNAITISTILQHTQKGLVKVVYSLKTEIGELMEIEALETSKVIGTPCADIKVPKGVQICGFFRADTFYAPTSKEPIQAGDTVYVLTERKLTKEVEKLFSAGLFFF